MADVPKVITVGVFDLFHFGHFNLLRKARSFGGSLTVGVHHDTLNIKQVKFFYTLEERMEMIRSLRFVDKVLSYERVDLLLETEDFDVFVYGEDQSHEYFQRAFAYCAANNKRMLQLPRTEGISSSALRDFLKTNFAAYKTLQA